MKALSLGMAVTSFGCQTLPRSSTNRIASTNDACAERLHDICGRLLLHYSNHRRLPERLDALESTQEMQLPSLWCPVSKKPYIYARNGEPRSGQPGRLILFDSEANHSGMRWGVFVNLRGDKTIMDSRVILIE
jgi:hypothetical protein